ncbi:MAG: ImmA/IrrE family metallo-endopeptidase [Pseudomonadota bacterium]
MTSDLSIAPDWMSADQGADEVRQTSALLRIAFGDRVATRVEDDWSKSVHSQVRLSAYPLALWFAASWWQLRWEPAPWGPRSGSWRMAHETAAAGYGFIWLRLVFESDGETMDATCRPSDPASSEPVRYLADFRASIPAPAFERAIDGFVALVLARLNAVGSGNTELHKLWRAVLEERADPEAATYRRFEACLGFEPDEAPEAVLKDLRTLSSEAGEAAIAEIAPVCAGSDPSAVLAKVIDLSQSAGVEGRIALPGTLDRAFEEPAYVVGAPWERGRLLARTARSAFGLATEPVSDMALAKFLEVQIGALTKGDGPPGKLPLGLAVRRETPDRVRLLFRKRNRPGRRFEAARFLADRLLAPREDRWLPATDAKTARQKTQRAFAAEFLCPIDTLQAFLDGDLANEAIEDAGEHFGVSPLAVKSHLANNGLLSPEAVAT